LRSYFLTTASIHVKFVNSDSFICCILFDISSWWYWCCSTQFLWNRI